MNDMRARYLNQRVMTATPGQRVVMLYDRLALDLTRAADIYETDPTDFYSAGSAVDHAMAIIAELAGSLRDIPDSPSGNLSALYGYLLKELAAVRGGETGKLAGARTIVETLRTAWTDAVTSASPHASAAGSWVG